MWIRTCITLFDKTLEFQHYLIKMRLTKQLNGVSYQSVVDGDADFSEHDLLRQWLI